MSDIESAIVRDAGETGSDGRVTGASVIGVGPGGVQPSIVVNPLTNSNNNGSYSNGYSDSNNSSTNNASNTSNTHNTGNVTNNANNRKTTKLGRAAREQTINSVLLEQDRATRSDNSEGSFAFVKYICCLCTYLDNGVLEQYRTLAKWNTVFHVASAGVELWDISQQAHKIQDVGMEVIIILVAITSVINAGICWTLIYSVSRSLCLYSVLFSIIAVLLYIVLLGYGSEVLDHHDKRMLLINGILSAIQIVIQFLPMVFMYRFWDYLTYNYDFNRSEGSSDNFSSRRLDTLVGSQEKGGDGNGSRRHENASSMSSRVSDL
jgi:hypothetical protein